MLTLRELATLLAALRHWQQTQAKLSTAELVATWPQLADHEPLSADEIHALCQRLNFEHDSDRSMETGAPERQSASYIS